MTAAVTRKLEDVLNDTRTAAEYRTASVHLWELAAGQTLSSARDAIAQLAAEYENLADQMGLSRDGPRQGFWGAVVPGC
jgi:hypothetical protein